MSIFGISATDLQNSTSVETVKACFDDSDTGVLNLTAMNAVIDRGEQEVLSWLVTELGPPPLSATVLAQLAADPFLKYAAIEYVLLYMFDRHPEYVRSGTRDRASRKEAADLRMQRVLDARQRPPTVPTAPANVGGVAVDNAPRLYTDGPGFSPSNRHSGDY